MSQSINKYQCILFDCDGTLINSEFLYSTMLASKIRYFGYEFSDERCRQLFKGMNYDFIRPWLVKNLKNFPIEKFEIKLFSEAAHELPNHLDEIPGAKKLLTELKNYPKCLVTNGHLHIINYSLELTNLKQYFKDDELFTCELVKNPKPAPDLYSLACEKMKVDPKNCIALEDSLAGITSAVSAGINTVGIIANKEDNILLNKMLNLGAMKIIYKLKDFKELLFNE